jgi:prepilin-type N-terminal cleavage/methylation domain-containing protein
MKARHVFHGFSVIELLVVLAIVSLLMALLLPAVQASRESVRRVSCANHLKQIGLAATLHHDTHGHFPTDGWGYQWIGDPDRGFGQDQPGGWIYNLLPYLERADLRELGRSDDPAVKRIGLNALTQVPLEVFHCPTRRQGRLYPYTEMNFPLRNADAPLEAAKSDYAISAGHEDIPVLGGPRSASPADVQGYMWPPLHAMTGVSFVRSQIGYPDVLDGASNTILVGEKYVSLKDQSQSLGDDQTMYLGDDADIRRWTVAAPIPDRRGMADISRFGSAHVTGAQFVLCDGAVRHIAFSVTHDVFQRLGNRRDGQPVSWAGP